ncbi:MAG TPA: PIN domain-containing protein [Stellaceae bacterium]|nr:PIN domain-containing protein [Stellaceae bacterium]
MIYTDSSVALAHLFREPQRPPDSFWRQPLVSSKLLEYEVWNRVHAYRLTASHSEEARQLLARVVLIELGEPVLARALEPFPVAVRTLDALHLATMNFTANADEPIELASYDRRLITAAEALGIPLAAL